MSKANGKFKALVAYCRACQSRIQIENRPVLYDMVSCQECDEVFEIVQLAPLRLDWPSDFVDDYEWHDDHNDSRTFEE